MKNKDCKTWVDFLEKRNICHRDYEGNMPCDNGGMCDRCQADWISEDYKQWKEQEA